MYLIIILVAMYLGYVAKKKESPLTLGASVLLATVAMFTSYGWLFTISLVATFVFTELRS
jgi:hypothetical protein